jgi:hypothetical protein
MALGARGCDNHGVRRGAAGRDIAGQTGKTWTWARAPGGFKVTRMLVLLQAHDQALVLAADEGHGEA